MRSLSSRTEVDTGTPVNFKAPPGTLADGETMFREKVLGAVESFAAGAPAPGCWEAIVSVQLAVVACAMTIGRVRLVEMLLVRQSYRGARA